MAIIPGPKNGSWLNVGGSILGTAAGEAVVPGLGSLTGPMGAGLVSALRSQAKKGEPELEVDALVYLKLTEDFQNSCVSELSDFDRAINEYRIRLAASLEVYTELSALKPLDDLDWIKSKITAIQKDVRDSISKKKNRVEAGQSIKDFIPDRLKRCAEILLGYSNGQGRSLRVSCECIHPAAVSSILALRDESLFGLCIDVEYHDTAGVEQIKSVRHCTEEVDFLITASAAFNLTGVIEKLEGYSVSLPLHWSKQIVLYRPKLLKFFQTKIFYNRLSINRNIRVLNVLKHSTSEEELFARRVEIRGVEIREYSQVKELSSCFANLDRGEAVICWEPLASVFMQANWAKQLFSPYYNIISLYHNNKYNHPDHIEIKRNFIELLLYQWIYLSFDVSRANSYLHNLDDFNARFKIGSGFQQPR